MPDCARDIMVRDFDFINENAPVEQAITKILEGRLRPTGYKTVSLMVTNDMQQLVGVVTLFDVLYHLRPAFLNFGIDGEYVAWEGMLEPAVRELKGKQVKNIMSRGAVTASPDDHVMALVDRMVKNKYRRLPVVDNGKLTGIVYVTDVFHYLFKNRNVNG
ncbi:MAG: CBS domain-containing protein [Thermodesulfobacteriota bacterium]|nr:CBS domain-containing protein [Thermodesulfobacteriota bacterium]